MSKALLGENDAQEEEDDEETTEAVSLPANTPNYITPQGHAKLTQELDQLLRIERPNVVDTVSWAASNGDRSENGDYIYGKRRLREIDRRIRFLSKRLEIAQIVDPCQQTGNDQIFFGACVTVQEDDQSFTYTIVGRDETDLAQGRISWISPLARALLKQREGDRIRFMSPAGPRQLDILEVRYLPLEP